MVLEQKIIQILEDENSDDIILNLPEPWEDIRNALFSILLDHSKMNYWYDVCAVIYSSISKRDYPVNHTIALLHTCLEMSHELDENLVWSITKDLKKIDYLADYDPYQDPEVLEEIKQIGRN